MSCEVESKRRYFERPELYLNDNFNVQVRARIVRQFLGDVSDSQLLDLGCGDGSISLQFLSQRNEVTLVDLSRPMLERARSKVPDGFESQVNCVHSDILKLESEPLFDVVICVGVLAHLSAIEPAIRKIASFLKPNGRCILDFINVGHALGKLHYWSHTLRRCLFPGRRYTWQLNWTTLSDVLASAAQHDLRPVTRRGHLLLFPGMWHLPNSWLLKYDQFVADHTLLSAHGREVVVLFQKGR